MRVGRVEWAPGGLRVGFRESFGLSFGRRLYGDARTESQGV